MANSYKIGPHDRLPVGTTVRVGIDMGKVLSWREVRSQTSGTVIVHTIRFTIGSTYKDREVNYDQILVIK